MATAPDPERTRPGRRTLALLTVPIVGFIILNNIGAALAPDLVNSHPLLLIALNSQNRNLVLVTNRVDAWGYYLIGTLRLVISDPLFFLVGYWYGDVAMEWMERRTKTLGTTLRQWEHGFSKAMYPVVFLAPNQWVCMFAGAAGMSVPGFFATNIVGTFARLYLLRRVGESFEAPIDDLLGWIGDHRVPLLIISTTLAVVWIVAELRKGGPGLEELADLAEAADAADATDVTPEADDPETV